MKLLYICLIFLSIPLLAFAYDKGYSLIDGSCHVVLTDKRVPVGDEIDELFLGDEEADKLCKENGGERVELMTDSESYELNCKMKSKDLCNGTSDQPSGSPQSSSMPLGTKCPPGWVLKREVPANANYVMRNFCYKVLYGVAGIGNAQHKCRQGAPSASLVSIHTDTEAAIVRQIVNAANLGGRPMYIGLQTSGGWRCPSMHWLDRSPADYVNCVPANGPPPPRCPGLPRTAPDSMCPWSVGQPRGPACVTLGFQTVPCKVPAGQTMGAVCKMMATL